MFRPISECHFAACFHLHFVLTHGSRLASTDLSDAIVEAGIKLVSEK